MTPSEAVQVIGALQEQLAAMTKERDHWADEEARLRTLLDRAAEVTAAHRERVRWLEQVVVELAARSVGVNHG